MRFQPRPQKRPCVPLRDLTRRCSPRSGCRYVPRFRGKYLYLGREDSGNVEPICRLEYIRRKRLWEIAIYKHGAGRYDPEDWGFPGNQMVDGTIEGALKAGMLAYP
jgi:hypothetical protein